MEPAIKTGSIVIVLPFSTYKNGDIITFGKEGKNSNLITHRVMTKYYPDGIEKSPAYFTSGDANEDFDNGSIAHEEIVGKAIVAIPYLGYVANQAKQPYGFLLLVIVPATIIIYEELKNVLKELFTFLKKLALRKKTFENKDKDLGLMSNESPGSAIVNRSRNGFVSTASFILVLLIPIIGSALVFTGLAISLFSDTETSKGNVLQAADWSPPVQVAKTLVVNEFLWNSTCTPNPETKFFLELYNGYDVQVDIKDWQFKDGNSNTIQISNAQFFIQPGQFVLITKSNSTFTGCYTNPTNATILNLGGNPDFTPAATGGVITLEKPVSPGVFEVVDRIEYGPTLNGGALNAGNNLSIERVPAGLDTALGNTFAVSDFIEREVITPDYGTDLVLNELVANPDVTHTTEWVEIYNPSASSINLTNWTLVDTANNSENITSLGTINSLGFATYDRAEGWLNNTGDTLKLVNPSGLTIDQHAFGALSDDQSTGRNVDRGNDWILPCTAVSKNTSNNNQCQP